MKQSMSIFLTVISHNVTGCLDVQIRNLLQLPNKRDNDPTIQVLHQALFGVLRKVLLTDLYISFRGNKNVRKF